MYQVLFLGHGSLPVELLQAAELILGEQPKRAVRAISLPPGHPMEAYQSAVKAFVADAADKGGALLFTDLAGGSPFITAAQVYREYAAVLPMEIITGMNLPMVIEVLSGREYSTVAQGVETALTEGGMGIRAFSKVLETQQL